MATPYLPVTGSNVLRPNGSGQFRPMPPKMPLYASLPTTWPQGASAQPLPPYQPIAMGTRRQAGFTTYASRIKAGTTTLATPSGEDGSAPAAYGSRGLPDAELSRAATSRTSRRTTRVVYREASEEEELSAGDDEDQEGAEEISQEFDAPGAWLGLPLPANKTMVQEARPLPYPPWNDKQRLLASREREVLLPIKIDLEIGGYLIHDVFTWNKNEVLVSPLAFAERFLRELDLPEEHAETIAASIKQQIEDEDTAEFVVSPPRGSAWASGQVPGSEEHDKLPPQEKRKDARPWDWGLDKGLKDRLCKRRRGAASQTLMSRAEEPAPQPTEALTHNADAVQSPSSTTEATGITGDEEAEDDLRVMLSYEVQILRDLLKDRVEWDLSSPLTPEEYAAGLCQDLGLTGEAMPLIANAVRDEITQHKRAAMELYLVGTGAQYQRLVRDLEEATEEEREERIEWAAAKKRAELFGLPPPQLSLEGAASQGATPTPGPSGIDSPDLVPAVAEKRGRGRPPKYPRASGLEGELAGPVGSEPMLPAMKKRKEAEMALNTLLNHTAKPLQDIWRDWSDAKESGPSLERITQEDLERLAHEQLRAARRGKREQARAAPSRRRR